jgi:hypothetical protein
MNNEQIRAELIMLVEYFSQPETGKVEFWKIVAAKLSAAVGRNSPWTWRYIQSVYNDKLAPSVELGRAIRSLGAMIDNVPQVIANTEYISILAQPGTVKPGSLILVSSLLCAKPACRNYFVPNHPRRKYCPACSPPVRKDSHDPPNPDQNRQP